MSLFSKTHFVLWPQKESTQIYSSKSENNTFSFDINLWKKQNPQDLRPLILYLQKNKIKSCQVLIPDDVVLTRSFVYDTKINSIEKKEVISLAQGFTPFDINPDAVSYQLVNNSSKTIIRTTIYNQQKLQILKSNLAQTGVNITSSSPVSSAVSHLINTFFHQEYFILYPHSDKQYTLILAKGEEVFLTVGFKGPSFNVQKTINYSKLYFFTPIKKIFLPHHQPPDIISTTALEKTSFDATQIAQNLNQPTNLPLPVISLLSSPRPSNPGIIKTMKEVAPVNLDTNTNSTLPMQSDKKNILPIVAVFILTAAIVSVVIWFVLNRSDSSSPLDQADAPVVTQAPSPTPIPTLAEINKNIKLQVLNATDINGQAASLKESLTTLGFTDITVGNSKETVDTNQIQLKVSAGASISAYFKDKLVDIFPATYDPTLKDGSTYDVVFIIGTDLRDQDKITPTTKLTPTATEASPTVEATPTVVEDEPTETPTPTPK